MIRLSKILTIEVIILLIGISVISSANDINIEDELIENPEIEHSDNQIELISYITGLAFDVDKTGNVFNEPIEITAYKMSINIFGIKIPSIYSFNMFFNLQLISYVKASRFFGRVSHYTTPPTVRGFAIGNIEWE